MQWMIRRQEVTRLTEIYSSLCLDLLSFSGFDQVHTLCLSVCLCVSATGQSCGAERNSPYIPNPSHMLTSEKQVNP